jgi:hypothetical protein
MIAKLLAAWCLQALTVTIHAAGLSAMLRHALSRVPDTRLLAVTRLLVSVAWWLLLLHLAEISVWALFYWWQQCLPDAESSFYSPGSPRWWVTAIWCCRTRGGCSARSRIDRHPDVRTVHRLFFAVVSKFRSRIRSRQD